MRYCVLFSSCVNLHPDSRVVNEARSGRSRGRGQEHEAKAEAEAKIALIISQILHFDPIFSRKKSKFSVDFDETYKISAQNGL